MDILHWLFADSGFKLLGSCFFVGLGLFKFGKVIYDNRKDRKKDAEAAKKVVRVQPKKLTVRESALHQCGEKASAEAYRYLVNRLPEEQGMNHEFMYPITLFERKLNKPSEQAWLAGLTADPTNLMQFDAVEIEQEITTQFFQQSGQSTDEYPFIFAYARIYIHKFVTVAQQISPLQQEYRPLPDPEPEQVEIAL